MHFICHFIFCSSCPLHPQQCTPEGLSLSPNIFFEYLAIQIKDFYASSILENKIEAKNKNKMVEVQT